ncbi:MAG: gamma-glutamyltransferase family protein [Myxococcota bacterium]|nr:gamma-glutamyltransferase family protein [Myxococcota bacterium]
MTRRDVLAGAGAAIAASCSKSSSRPASGMVASSQRLATDVGVKILRAGGNAADAAVAVAAALNVTEPTSTGLGGDCFALYYDVATRGVTALNGSGRAPRQLTLERLAAQQLTELPRFHAHTITIPGACAGWCDLISKHGSMAMTQILAPAIELAESGFPVGEYCAWQWAKGLAVRPDVASLRELSIEGRAPRAGEHFRNPGLARTLRAIANGGPQAFYTGEIADAIIRVIATAGGVMTRADLAAHVSTWDEPISTIYRGIRVWESPPNGQGITALLALNILEGFELRGQDPVGVDRFHLLVEALRVAFADTRWYVADPRFAKVPVAELLSKDYAARRRTLVDPKRAAADVTRGAPVAGTDTVYFCVVDARGNACSFINSNYMGFGTGIVPAGWGFTLHNRGHNFSLDPKHPNALAPNKRPYHTIIPGMMTRPDDNSLYAPFGVMGGFMQPQGHVQVVVGMLDDDASPQPAVDRARFCIEPVEGKVKLQLETGLLSTTVDGLRSRGHDVVADVAGFERVAFGRGQIIRRRGDGLLEAGSDPRSDGSAAAS